MTPPDESIGEVDMDTRHEKNLAALFGDEPETTEKSDTSEVADEPEATEIEETEEVSQDEVSDTSKDTEDADEDYEAPIKGKKDADEDEEPKDETMARKMAKENGRKAKMLEAKTTELELEIERIRSEKEALETQLNEAQAVNVNPWEYPEVKEVRDKVMADVKRGAAMLGAKNPKAFRDNFGTYLDAFMETEKLDDEALDSAVATLRNQIIKEVGGFEEDYEDLMDSDQSRADTLADKAMAIIERAVPETRRAIELAKKVESRAKVSQFAVGTREYEAAVSEFKPLLDAIGDLPEEAIAADPHSVPAVVARMVKDSPEARRRVEKAKADVLEIILGPRALTPDEVARLEANGKDLKSFYTERQKLVAEKRRKLLPLLVQGLATRAVFADSLKKLATYETDKADEGREFDAMEGARKQKPAAPKKKVAAGPRRNSVLAEMFGDRYDEL